MSPIKHTDSALCNCPICLAVRAMRTRLLCRSHVLFPWHGRPARGKPGSNLGPGRPGSLVNASAVGGSLTRFPWWIQSSQIGQVMHHGRGRPCHEVSECAGVEACADGAGFSRRSRKPAEAAGLTGYRIGARFLQRGRLNKTADF